MPSQPVQLYQGEGWGGYMNVDLLGMVLIHPCSYLCCRTLPSRLSTGNGSTRTSVGSAASSRTTSSSCGSTLRDTAIVDSRGVLALLLWTASCGIVLGCIHILTGLFHPYKNVKKSRVCTDCTDFQGGRLVTTMHQ